MYTTIRLGNNHKAHIFNHNTDKVLCGVNRWHHTPFNINKTTYKKTEMLKRHKSIAKRRGGSNPYKFLCKKCESILTNTKVRVNKV